MAFASAMILVAHPDDADFMCAGTVARWAGEGCEVHNVA
jgi:LmbE family N-acetylglucosaminyl deacetylase